MERPKNCYECLNYLPDTKEDLKANGECMKFGYFVNGRNKACQFGELKAEIIKESLERSGQK